MILVFAAAAVLPGCACAGATAASSAPDGPREQLVFLTASWTTPAGDFSGTVTTAAAIAKVKVLSGAKEMRFNQPDLSRQIFPDSYVLTPVEIEQVYKSDGKHKPGDIVRIEEYYATAQSPTDPGLTLVFTSGFSFPMRVGHKYIVFLGPPQFAGDYAFHTADFGKFLYNDKTRDGDPNHELSDTDWEIGGPGGPGVPPAYFAMATQVMKTYGR
jgi:hypothetical protein